MMGPCYKGTVMPAWANNGYGTRGPESLDSKLDAWTHKRPKLDAWTHRRTPYQPCWRNDGVCRQFVTGKKSSSNDNGMKSKLTNRSQYSGGWRGETPCSSQGAAAHGRPLSLVCPPASRPFQSHGRLSGRRQQSNHRDGLFFCRIVFISRVGLRLFIEVLRRVFVVAHLLV